MLSHWSSPYFSSGALRNSFEIRRVEEHGRSFYFKGQNNLLPEMSLCFECLKGTKRVWYLPEVPLRRGEERTDRVSLRAVEGEKLFPDCILLSSSHSEDQILQIMSSKTQWMKFQNLSPDLIHFFLKNFFCVCVTLKKSLLNLLHIASVLCFGFFTHKAGIWDCSSPARDQTHTSCVRRQSFNHSPPRKPLIPQVNSMYSN